jgi:hypothetical protein
MNAVSVSEDDLRVHCICVFWETAAYVFCKAVSLAVHCVSWKSINVEPTCSRSTLSVLHFCVEMPIFYICVSLVNVTMNKSYTYFSKHIRNAVPLCFCRWSHWECVAAVCSEALICRMCCHALLIITSRNTVCVSQGTSTSNAEFVYSSWYCHLEWRVCVSLELLTSNLEAVQSWVSLPRNAMYMYADALSHLDCHVFIYFLSTFCA